MNEDFGQKIIEKIEEKKISPEPKWKFLVQDYSVWAAIVIGLAVGGLAVALIIFSGLNNDLDLHHEAGMGFWECLLFCLPYIWIILLALFLALVYFGFRRTPGGYRYHFYTILAIIVIVGAVLGCLFHFVGFGETLEKAVSEKMPALHGFNPRYQLWQQTERGLLGGQVIEARADGRVILRDFAGAEWQVNTAGCGQPCWLEFEAGDQLRLIGQESAGHIFEARIISPFYPQAVGN